MADQHTRAAQQFAFLPWLRLKEPCRIAGVEFLPWREMSGSVPPVLADSVEPMSAILSGYVDREGKPVDNCVVATIPGHGWNLMDSEFESIRWAASLLFLATWASNEYYSRFGGPYVNSNSFRVVWQRFSEKPVWVSLSSRRRDGRTLDGGYRHGEVTFALPLQCSLQGTVIVDQTLLTALDSAHSSNCRTIRRLRYALPFIELANTDDDLMTETAEAVLMGSAFEQLLCGDASAYKLGKKFGDLFASFGSITVAEAKRTRTGIEIDQSTPKRAAAQPQWWVHRKWMEELYDVRSKSVHEGTASGRTWGWDPVEHLVMAAWVFPLAVKLLLREDGQYALSDADGGRCLTVDKLLATTGWADDASDGSRWQETVTETKSEHAFELAARRALECFPELCGGEALRSHDEQPGSGERSA